jgi:hypothetical protein
MRPEYARAIDWPISQAWRRALIEATGLTPKNSSRDMSTVTIPAGERFDTARSDVGCGDDGDRASGMDASQHHVPALDDGVNFFDLADAASGVEISRALQPSTALKIDQSYTRYVNHLKV